MYIAYNEWHYGLIEKAFGSRGVDIAQHTPLALATDGYDRTNFDQDWAIVRQTAHGFDNPFIVVHEFAHYYHVLNWRDLSLSAPTIQCEAAAHLAELALAVNAPEYAEAFTHRYSSGWSEPVRELLTHLQETGQLPLEFVLHDEMEKILAGRYIDSRPPPGVVSQANSA